MLCRPWTDSRRSRLRQAAGAHRLSARNLSLKIAILVGLLLLVPAGLGAAEATAWKAGLGRANITPEQFMWMAGYGGRSMPAEGKLTDLWAKALALENADGKRAVLVTLDLVGIDAETTERICSELAARCKLERDQVALATSHTHCGPVVGKNLAPMHYWMVDDAQRALIDQYQTRLIGQVVEIVEQALADLQPAAVAQGSGYTTFAVNRRNNAEAQVPQLRAAGALVGPVDHDVPVLSVRDASGQLKAVVFGYACHATVMGFYQWSGDYPGFAQMALEEMHPGCQAMFWAGCGADQNPLPRREVEHLELYGRQLAVAVDQVLKAPMTGLDGHLETHYQEIDLPLARIPSRDEIAAEAESSDRYLASRAKMFLASIDQGQPLPETYAYPIQRWQIGKEGVDWIFLGGEVVVDYALRLKLERQGERTWVVGYANDVMAYIPSRRVLNEGGYEGAGAMVYYGLPSPWTEECERLIIDAVHAK